MKKKIPFILLGILCAAVVCWFAFTESISISREDVASIEVHTANEYAESSFTIMDEGNIHYITDFLNHLILFPYEDSYSGFQNELTFLDASGNVITRITLPNHDSIITEKGIFNADVGELNTNLNYIEKGEPIRTSMQSFGLLLISWLFIILLIGLAGLLIFLIQMVLCYRTDSLALRLLPAEILLILWLSNYHTQIITSLFYWASILGLNSGEAGIYLLLGVVVLCLVLGWCQGDSARKAAGN